MLGKAEMICRQCQERGTDKPHVLPGGALCSPLPLPVAPKRFPIDPPTHRCFPIISLLTESIFGCE